MNLSQLTVANIKEIVLQVSDPLPGDTEACVRIVADLRVPAEKINGRHPVISVKISGVFSDVDVAHNYITELGNYLNVLSKWGDKNGRT